MRKVRRLTVTWFGDGGRIAAAVVRVAIATAVLLTLHHVGGPVSTGDLPGEHTLYRPVGLWMLLGHTPPPPWLLSILWGTAYSATVAMLVGLATRATTAISCVCACALGALVYADSHT